MHLFKRTVVGTLISLCAAQAVLAAQPDKGRHGVGLGVILGEPTGISAKGWLDKETAVDAAAAWAFSGHSSFQVHADYLKHVYDVIDASSLGGRLPFYYGVGGRVKFHDERNGAADTRVGVRIPFGFTYLPDGAPFDLFFEIVPVLDATPSTDLRLNAAIGGRYYF